jgi:transposase-like protein
MTDRTCTATAKAGRPCRAPAKHGHDLCSTHLDAARRPTLLTEDLHHSIVALVRNGNYLAHAAAAMGVHRSTLYAWLRQGEDDSANGHDTAQAAFFDACARARGEAIAVRVQRLELAARNGDSRVDQWFLERVAPNEYGPPALRVQAQVETEPPAPAPQMESESISDEEYRARMVARLRELGISNSSTDEQEQP